MKRLHIIGKSKDNRRLYLARAKDAKFGSFEIPISAKLLKLLREAEDAKGTSSRRVRGKAAAEEPSADAASAPAAAAPAGPDTASPAAETAPASPPAARRRAAVASAPPEGAQATRPRGATRAAAAAPAAKPGDAAASQATRDAKSGPARGDGSDRAPARPASPARAPAATPAEASARKRPAPGARAGTPVARATGADRPARPATAPSTAKTTDADEIGSVRVVRRSQSKGDTAPTAAPGAEVDLPLAPRARAARRGDTGSKTAAEEQATPKRPRRKSPAARKTEKRAQASPMKEERFAMTPRTKRPEIPARSKLKPAEIQSLIRAGRTVRTVAQMAGTQVAWVKWLAEPVQQERMAIVGQALGQRQTRARLGASAEPLGTAVALNLRSRGVSGADRVVEEGFTAVRPNGRTWRLRLSFEHRGRRTSAVWSYDPQRREVTPVNTLAAQLGWRRPRTLPAGAADGPDADGAAPRRTRRASKTSGRRTTTKSSSRRRSS